MTLLFRQLFDTSSGTYTYLLADTGTREAVLIDPVYEQHERDLALIRELDLRLLYSLDTHCHADHVTGAWLLKDRLGCKIAASAASGVEGLDQALNHGDLIQFGKQHLQVRATPGHTDGCISYVLEDKSMVFTGDCLLIRGCGRTDFQQGSAATLFHSITEQLFTLPDDCLICPGHDYQGRTVSSIGEEKRLNPRVGGGANEQDFAGYLDNMKLPHPKQIDLALPANLKAGLPSEGNIPDVPDWAPVITTYSGNLEIEPQWVAAHLDDIHILDVRTRSETEEEPALISGAQLIPLDELRDRLEEVPADKPVMTLCRSGRRSVMAFQILRENGWTKVANIQGGLLRWYNEGLPLQQDDPHDVY
jgi:glyoxylase-like metal-dependent hydrolase (beta-lactamase superfamily II)/rhodanese-related sulfurtransferase